ncbi:MAG: HAMP domain-containing sensor histidine kinase [Candidatus Dormibacteria bacterium]
MAVGSLAVALVSIVLLAAVILVATDADLVTAGREQEASTTHLLVTTLNSTYQAAGGWHHSTLMAVGELARTTGFGLEVSSAGHRLLDVEASQIEGPSRIFPIVVAGRRVGTATVQFPTSGLSLADAKLRRTIGTSVVAAAVLAALVAMVAAVVASRYLVAPLRLLTLAARRLGTGDLSSRVGDVAAPGEIDELAHAFDAMATHLQRQDTLRRAVVADLAHELRTPLAILQAELEALAVGVEELSPAAVVSLGEEVGRLSRLIEDLAVLSAAEAAELAPRRELIDLADVARSACARLGKRFSDQGIALSTEVASTTVLADPGRVEQMLVNLLSNAAKFTPSGGTVRVTVERRGGTGRVVVADTGVGIPLAEQGLVFNRFFRGEAARGTTGSGVGLAVVAELAAAQGGSAEVESTPGAGTTITLSLPSAQAAAPPVTTAQAVPSGRS